MIVGSYGYPSEDMLYNWKQPKAMNIADDPPMAQFKLKTWEANTTVTSHTNRKIESGYRTDSIAYIRLMHLCFFTQQPAENSRAIPFFSAQVLL